MSVVGHLLGGLRRAIGRVFLWFLVFGLIGAGIVEVVALVETHSTPTTLTHIIAAAMGLVLGYAAGLTVLVSEVIRFLVEAIHEAEKTVGDDLGNIGGIAGGVAQAIEKHL
ncbi:MAG TPA: hypothetical protein VF040_00135 [Ktedonobacterales bacterium]